MKIAFIGQKGIPAQQGGIEKHVEGLTYELAQANFDVYVYSRPNYTGNTKTKLGKINIVNLPSINTKNLDAITHTFLASVHALFQNYDIIHYQGVGPSLLSWIPRLFAPKTKVIATFHCIDRHHQKWGLFARLMLYLGEWTVCRFPHQTIVISQALEKYCQNKFHTTCHYVPQGIEIKPQSPTSDILKKYNLKKNNYFLTASRLVRHKGIHTLIKAYTRINSNKKLVIAGGSSNTDDYVSYLKQLAGSHPNIIFVGQQSGPDLETLFRNAYLFVQPSEAEGLSIALLEAIAYGTPVLVSDIPENLEALKGIGLSFVNKDIADLAKKLTYAEKHNQKISNQAKLLKQRVTKEHDWHTVTQDTIKVYQDALTGQNLKAKTKIKVKFNQ